ncbi:MAG: RES family NAD+ phosphorylase [Bacteroidales bacterium]|nr:RES family NAD+ phosphorylase [Bacteroidales bacterium]
MEVYRLNRERFAGILSGRGSALKGARWNSVGVEIIYTAENKSLAMAEVAVHLTLATLPSDFVMMTIFIPDHVAMREVSLVELPFNWNAFPYPAVDQVIGDQFVTENSFCILKIPSAVTQGEFNYLINPRHPDFSQISIKEITKFPFDKRIFK